MKNVFVFANKLENQFLKSIDNSYFLISGMGFKSAFTLDNFLSKKNDVANIFNIGICGSTDKSIPLFSSFMINKTFKSDNQNTICDINTFNNIDFQISPCCTVDEVINSENDVNNIKKTNAFLFDMEIFYLKKIADKYNLPIYSFKTVTDYGDFKIFNSEYRKIALKGSSLLCKKISEFFK